MLNISITAELGPGKPPLRDQVDEALAALGFIREAGLDTIGKAVSGMSLLSGSEIEFTDEDATVAPDTLEMQAAPTAGAGEQPKRERGKASAGRQRRTKEEMAEDAAADAADAAAGRTPPGDKPQISASPEQRVGPEDSSEIQAQDAADEKAESDARKAANPALTLDDVREAVGRYYSKYGMGPATADIHGIFGCKLHEIPDNQDAFAKAIAAVDAAATANPYGRSPLAGGAQPAGGPTLNDLKVVMGRYMKTYGEDEGYADLPKILGVETVKDLADDPALYAAKIKDVERALADNPFGRKAAA